MEKSKMSTGVKVALVVGGLLVVAGACWLGYALFGGNLTDTTVVTAIPNNAITDETPLPPMDKTYTEFTRAEDKNATIEDEVLDFTFLDAGKLADNEVVKTALESAGVTDDGYYFMLEMTYDSNDAYADILPFAMLTGHVGEETHVAEAMLYVAESDLTNVALMDHNTIQPNSYHVLIGFATYDEMDDAQFHFYNTDYQVAVLHTDDSAVVIEPVGYTPAVENGGE